MYEVDIYDRWTASKVQLASNKSISMLYRQRPAFYQDS